MIIGGSVSIAVIIFVSRRTTVTEEEVASLAKLHETPAEEISAEKTRITLLTPALLVVNGLAMPYLLITYYVRPYQLATGTLSADGSLDWFAGESIVAMSWALVYVTLGVFAMKYIRKAYSPSR